MESGCEQRGATNGTTWKREQKNLKSYRGGEDWSRQQLVVRQNP